MPTRTFLSLMLLSATCAAAATPDFLHGMDYTQWLPANVRQIATDDSGAIYLQTADANNGPASTVTKLSPDGKTIVWQTQLAFAVGSMTVDPSGGVYVTSGAGHPPFTVSKLRADGTGILWTQTTDFPVRSGLLPAIATDSGGRVYLAAAIGDDVHDGQIERLSGDGTTVDYKTRLQGEPNSIAVDGSGAAVVTGYLAGGSIFLAQFTPNGTAGFYSNVTNSGSPTVALDASGNAVVYSYGILLRFDTAGNVTSSKKIADPGNTTSAFALDASGNVYAMGSNLGKAAYPVKNSVAPCGTSWLSVVAPDGSIRQITYLPGTTNNPGLTPGGFAVARRDSSVLLAGPALTGYTPTRSGPFAADTNSGVLVRMALNTNAQPLSLTCASNGAVYKPSPVAPGEIFSLFGNGLGPQKGAEFRATIDSPYPTRLGDVEVTFDGKAVPLIWAQDTQINLVTPWSLTPGRDTEICVSYKGVKTNCLTLPVNATDPGVFMTNASYAMAYNEDGGLNTEFHAAPPNIQVTVFATGLGPITPSQAEGSIMGSTVPGNVLPVTVYGVTYVPGGCHFCITEMSVQTEVTSAGPALYHPVGVSQITFRILPRVNEYYVKLPSGQSQRFLIYNVN